MAEVNHYVRELEQVGATVKSTLLVGGRPQFHVTYQGEWASLEAALETEFELLNTIPAANGEVLFALTPR